jgi:hypothetical protein
MLVVRGVAGVSYIVNVAPSSNPTVLLTDHQNFDLRDFVLIGRSAYPNRGIDLTSASGGQRTGYGLISNVACYTNGTGIHIAGANDIVIRSCSYWPGGEAAVPGSPSFNTSGGNPVNLFGGILSDCIGVDGIYNPGSVNLIKIYDFNCGQCNTISGGGAAIKIDGSLASGGPNAGAQLPFTAWTLDGMDSGTCARALWVRNAIISKFRPTYCTAEVRIDQASANCVIENLYGSTVVVDGTQSLGGCKGIEFNGCEASTITADAANSNSIHRNCFWFAAAGAGDLDLSIGKMVLNGQLTSVPLADQIGGNGLCVGQSTGTPTVLSNNSVITPAGGVFQRFTSSGAVTGLSITAPNVNSGLFGRMLVIGNLNSSGSFTFAAAPGSNVANGTGCVIGPNTQKLFFWDKVNSIYYPSSTV